MSLPSSSAPSHARTVFMFSVSGWIGTALFSAAYELLYAELESGYSEQCGAYCAAVAWTVAYTASIVWQHALHRLLVFGSSAPYWRSLALTFVSYSLSLVLSSALNAVLVTALGVHHRVAFVGTLLATGVINFYTVRAALTPDAKTGDVGAGGATAAGGEHTLASALRDGPPAREQMMDGKHKQH
jgi:hypothetical protein